MHLFRKRQPNFCSINTKSSLPLSPVKLWKSIRLVSTIYIVHYILRNCKRFFIFRQFSHIAAENSVENRQNSILEIIYSIRELLMTSPKFTPRDLAAVLQRLIRDRKISKYSITELICRSIFNVRISSFLSSENANAELSTA